MIYVRSHRSIVSIGVAGVAWAAAFGVLALGASRVPEGGIAAIALAAGAIAGAGVAVWAAVRLLSWPRARLCFFRDRLLVIQGRHEMRAVWTAMETVTLSDPHSWPDVRMTDSLTIQLRNEGPLTFKPAAFGLQPPGVQPVHALADPDRVALHDAAVERPPDPGHERQVHVPIGED